MASVVKCLAVAVLSATVAVSADAEPVKVGNPGFPYSVPGSFLTVGRHEKGKYKFNTYPGLWIRNVSTCWREDVCRLVPSVGGRDVAVTECVMRDGWLEAKTEKGAIEFVCARGRDFAQVLQARDEVRILRELRRQDRRCSPRSRLHVDRLRVPRPRP